MSSLSRLGAGGSRPKTIVGHNNVIKHFNKMIELAQAEGKHVGVNGPLKPYGEWTKEDFGNEDVFGEMAYYLARNAVKEIKGCRDNGQVIPEDQDGEALAVSTAMQYMSNFVQSVLQMPGKVAFFDEFKHLPKGESPPWLKRIRDDLRNTMERDLMLAGIPTVLKAKGIGRVVLERIMDALINGGKCISEYNFVHIFNSIYFYSGERW